MTDAQKIVERLFDFHDPAIAIKKLEEVIQSRRATLAEQKLALSRTTQASEAKGQKQYIKKEKGTLKELEDIFFELLPEGPMKEGIDESLAALKPQPETEPLEEPQQQQQQPDPDNYREGE